MRIRQITDFLESVAPPQLQESYDNAGLLTGNPNMECTGALLCLDSTEAVLDEAIGKGYNLVIAHHPIIFSGLKRINGSSYIERVIIKAIKNDIAIYAIHTNLDNVKAGVNNKICDKLGLTDRRILSPKDGSPDNGTGAGMVGGLPDALAPAEFLAMLKKNMQTRCIRHTALPQHPIKTVAVCGGAGSFLLGKALAAGAQAFVTADYKYHQFFDADGKIMIADIGHYESEQFTGELLLELLNENFANFAADLTKANTNPIKYFQ